MIPGKTDPDNPGWQWVENMQGLGGWVPADILQAGEILEDFDTCELSVNASDIVEILDTRLGWTRARKDTGEVGWMPSTSLAP